MLHHAVKSPDSGWREVSRHDYGMYRLVLLTCKTPGLQLARWDDSKAFFESIPSPRGTRPLTYKQFIRAYRAGAKKALKSGRR